MQRVLVEDDRLPRVGDIVIVDVPRAVRHDRPVGSCRVTGRKDLLIRIESPDLSFPVPVGAPVAVTWGTNRLHLYGTVAAMPGPGTLHVSLIAPAQRREHPRFGLRIPATIECFEEPDAPDLSGEVVDLSEGGARICVGTRLGEGSQVFVSMDIPAVGAILVVAEVLDCTMPPAQHVYEARLRFVCISDAHRGVIGSFLRTYQG